MKLDSYVVVAFLAFGIINLDKVVSDPCVDSTTNLGFEDGDFTCWTVDSTEDEFFGGGEPFVTTSYATGATVFTPQFGQYMAVVPGGCLVNKVSKSIQGLTSIAGRAAWNGDDFFNDFAHVKILEGDIVLYDASIGELDTEGPWEDFFYDGLNATMTYTLEILSANAGDCAGTSEVLVDFVEETLPPPVFIETFDDEDLVDGTQCNDIHLNGIQYTYTGPDNFCFFFTDGDDIEFANFLLGFETGILRLDFDCPQDITAFEVREGPSENNTEVVNIKTFASNGTQVTNQNVTLGPVAGSDLDGALVGVASAGTTVAAMEIDFSVGISISFFVDSFTFDSDPRICQTPPPTALPTASPTASPTSAPTASPTSSPTAAPTDNPTAAPTPSPTIPECCLPGTVGAVANYAANECHGFVTCMEFRGSVINYGYQPCPGGLLYDVSLGVCNWPNHVACNEYCAFDGAASHRDLDEDKLSGGGNIRGSAADVRHKSNDGNGEKSLNGHWN